MTMRYFTLEEAENLLPQIKSIVSSIVIAKRRADKKVRDWRAKAASLSVAEKAMIKSQIEFLAKGINDSVDAIHKMGCLVKDLDIGLVDFPARIEGREGHLCWKLRETKIRYWHHLDEGYSGRKLVRRTVRLKGKSKQGVR